MAENLKSDELDKQNKHFSALCQRSLRFQLSNSFYAQVTQISYGASMSQGMDG